MTNIQQRRSMKRPSTPENYGQRQRKNNPLPTIKLQSRNHREQNDRNRKGKRHPEMQLHTFGLVNDGFFEAHT